MAKKKLALPYKLLISLISLVLSLTALELGLAAVGRIYYNPDEVYRDDELEAAGAGPAKTLVAVGDSFTHGGLVAGDATYTHFLRQILRERQYTGYRVKNLGICELNSGELLKRIPRIIDQHQPHAILLLVGATNRFNPWDYEAYANQDPVSSLKKNFFNLRVVKMARFIGLALTADQDMDREGLLSLVGPGDRSRNTRHDLHLEYLEERQEAADPDSPDEVARVWALYNEGRKAEALRRAESLFTGRSPRGRQLLFALTFLYLKNDRPDKVQEMIALATKNDRESDEIVNFMTFYRFELARWHRENLHYDEAIDWYLKAIALDPDADYFFFELNKIFDLQSRYTSKMLYDKLVALSDENPDIGLSQMYRNHLKLYRDKQKWEDGIGEWLRHDLDAIAALCRERGVKLIIQKYPISYPLANSVIEETAAKYGLPLVDHLARFQGLEPKSDFFYDDDHCTAAGHRIMAENILETLVKTQTVIHAQTN